MQRQSSVLVGRYLYSCDIDVVTVCLYLQDNTASGMKKAGNSDFLDILYGCGSPFCASKQAYSLIYFHKVMQ